MRLGDLLVCANIVSQADVVAAMARQREEGGRLGDALVRLGAASQEALEAFLERVPAEPETLAATGIPMNDLLALLMKQIALSQLETVAGFVEAMRLTPRLVEQLAHEAVSRGLLAALGVSGLGMRYELTERGRVFAQDALKVSLYAGPAPVPLADFCARVQLQKVTNEQVTYDRLKAAMADYTVTDEFLKQVGPALNAGRAILLYGPPGNGKTTTASRVAEVFNSVIYLPYAVLIDGQVMRVFDPSLHVAIAPPAREVAGGALRRDHADMRWVAVKRPFIVAGGELTLGMLDLCFDPLTGFYEAPLHIKALGGCFMIDDLGRQLLSPTALLNRWIVPMESKVDYLKLHTGKSFAVPFEALLIFSTNLDPEALMDPAFLRRLPYKIEVGAPSLETYYMIFKTLCAKAEVAFSEEAFRLIVTKVVKEKGMELAVYHAKFIVDQVVAISRFLGCEPVLDAFSIDYAVRNLKVRGPARELA